MKKLLRKLNKKTDWFIPFYFQFIHAFGLLVGAFLLTLWGISFFQILKPYSKFILLLIWTFLVIVTSKLAFKGWRKGFLISTGILLIIYIFHIISTP